MILNANFNSDAQQNTTVSSDSATQSNDVKSSLLEAEFGTLCDKIRVPIKVEATKAIVWNPNDQLKFFHSLAFFLSSKYIACIAVSSFKNSLGETKLYIASNHTLSSIQKAEINEILVLLLDGKPLKEIDALIIPRLTFYILKHLTLLIVKRI